MRTLQEERTPSVEDAREHLPPEIASSASGAVTGSAFPLSLGSVRLQTVERGLVRQALELVPGNQPCSARLLGLTRDEVRYRMEKRGLP